jgi:hypothetical protein
VADEFVSHKALSLFGEAAKSLRLPVRETPQIPWDSFDQWAKVDQDDLKADCGPALQAAIDSGKTTVYFPNGTYMLESDVFVRGKVRRIIGCETRIEGSGKFIVEDGDEAVVVIERLKGTGGGIAHDTARTLVIRQLNFNFRPGTAKWEMSGKGDLFIEDFVASSTFEITGGNVWARQLNVEQWGTHVRNNGATVWCLGYKTENGGVQWETCNGATTELLGGFVYSIGKEKDTPFFVNDESTMVAAIGESNFHKPSTAYQTLVRETQNGVTRECGREEFMHRGQAAAIPLYCGLHK